MRDKIRNLISLITPYDQLERKHISDVLEWIDSGVKIFRIEKPDIPPQHLVSYFVLVDQHKKKLLLINHIKANLLLPPGGHVELNEHPTDTVKREIKEELDINAQFINQSPFFITVTETINTDAGHTDVSLWYLLKGDSDKELVYDKEEISGLHWLTFDAVLNLANNTTDPHMHRFVKKFLTTVK